MTLGSAGSHHLVEHLFRHEAGQLIATLTRILGVHNLAIAEEIVQDTLLKALQVWPYHPPIQQPVAWLRRVAKNKAIDHLRHHHRHRRLVDAGVFYSPPSFKDANDWSPIAADQPLDDELLRMIFLCCEPSLPIEDQVALCLQLVGGLSAKEIAAAFFIAPETMRKRLYRAKQSLKQKSRPYSLPGDDQLRQRIESVLAVLYLMFNEGYHSQSDGELVRRELCAEALRLIGLLLQHPRLIQSEIYALAALMSFQAARLPTRLDTHGDILVLASQDRTVWNAKLISQGFAFLQRSRTASTPATSLSQYHLEAGIAAVHCAAPSLAATHWHQLLMLYDNLLQVNPSPMVHLNRSIVVGYVHGPEVALSELEPLQTKSPIKNHYLLLAALAEFAQRAGQDARAMKYLDAAISQAPNDPQYRFLIKRRARIQRAKGNG